MIEIKKSSSFSISYKLIRFLVILISLPFGSIADSLIIEINFFIVLCNKQ